MAPRDTHPVDWGHELKKLKPFLDGKGGVIRIVYDGDDCAPREFSEVIKALFEGKPDNKKWRSIRIDRYWYSTRFLPDILHEFDRKLADEPAVPSDKDAPSSVNIFADTVFHDTAEIELTNVTINSPEPLQLPAQRDKRIRAICEKLKNYLSRGGRMMVVLNHAPANEQSEFWRQFWHEGLETLVSAGLVFVQMVDRSSGKPVFHDHVPAPDLELELPARFDEARADQAYDNLMDILRERLPGMSDESIAVAVQTHLTNNEDSIKRLHDNLPKLIVTLAKDQSRGA